MTMTSRLHLSPRRPRTSRNSQSWCAVSAAGSPCRRAIRFPKSNLRRKKCRLARDSMVFEDTYVYNSNFEVDNDRSNTCDVDSCTADRAVGRDEAVRECKDSRGDDDSRGGTVRSLARRDGTGVCDAVCDSRHVQTGLCAVVVLLRRGDRDGAVARCVEGQSFHPSRAALDRRLHSGSIDLFLIGTRGNWGLTASPPRPTNTAVRIRRTACDSWSSRSNSSTRSALAVLV